MGARNRTAVVGTIVLSGVMSAVSFAQAASATDLCVAAKGYYDSRDYGNAEKAYRQALEISPQDRKALQGLGDTLNAEGKYEDAATTFEKLSDALLHPQAGGAQAAPPAAPAVPPPPLPQANARRPAPAPAAPPQAAPPVPMAAQGNVGKPMNGLCGYIHVGPQGSLFMHFLMFSPQGYIYTGPPTNESWAQLQKRDPDYFGTYTYDGKTLNISLANGHKETHEFDGGSFDGDPIQKAGQVQGGALDGSYETSTNAMSFGHVTAFAGGDWIFHADGTFGHSGYAGVETERHVTGTGEAPGNATGGQSAQSSGHYTIGNGVLTLNGTERHSIYYLGDDQPPTYLSIDGITYMKH